MSSKLRSSSLEKPGGGPMKEADLNGGGG